MTNTPLRAIRIDDELWTAAQLKATAEQSNVSDIVRAHLTQWINEDKEAAL